MNENFYYYMSLVQRIGLLLECGDHEKARELNEMLSNAMLDDVIVQQDKDIAEWMEEWED